MQSPSALDAAPGTGCAPARPVSGGLGGFRGRRGFAAFGSLCAAAWRQAARAARAVAWYMGHLMGDSAYATYAAHARRHHPDEEPMTEREFWRRRMDDQDRNPGARCC